ncbi:nuclear protein localization protein 4 [Pancytospora philotis]|nr:nuclear protein localization protein 4 [Pancytospora philotis]
MKLIVRTPVSQLRVEIERAEELDSAVKETFKVETFKLFQNAERTEALDRGSLHDRQVIYMSYDMQTPKVHQAQRTCEHPPEAVCPKCASLDPLDQSRSDGVRVKYLSYGSYKAALEAKSQTADEHDYQTRECDDHPKNVRCSKCTERAVTLVPQVFRMVDYVEFSNTECVEALIARWRSTGRQHIGLLVGRMVDHKDTPFGQRAVVDGVWEVGQECFPDGAVLKCLPSEFIYPGLQILGLVYTDLWTVDGAPFSYKEKLGMMVSAVELNFFYEVLQGCCEKKKSAMDIPFVNICLSSDENGEISPKCFMLTRQFIGLMRAHALALTTDPQYFETQRDISYLIRNEYGKNVSAKASPFVPIDYFVVTCEIGYSKAERNGPEKNGPEKNVTGQSVTGQSVTGQNEQTKSGQAKNGQAKNGQAKNVLGENGQAQNKPMQSGALFSDTRVLEKTTAKEIARYFNGDFSFPRFSNFSLLMALTKHVSFVPALFKAVVERDSGAFAALESTEEFQAMVAKLRECKVSSWNCPACTYLNEPDAAQCQMCFQTRQ